MSKLTHDVFISYNHQDRSFVEFLVRTLERAGLRCFQDVTGLKIFEKLDASLKDAISRSRWLVAVISPSYLRSYWCLFEALEAIQGQDLEQRFLPVIVRYRPEDQLLNEDFVLSALRVLDEQMNEFETKLVRLKAYDLAPKLDKLRFVRSNLPMVFRHIHERIYPAFSLWDDTAIRTTLEQILNRLAPRADIDLTTLALNFDRLDAMPVVVPRLSELPQLLWKTRVGRQAWKNSPLVVGNQVFITSAGARWNESDPEDGIYCLDAETGETQWFVHTSADANQLLVSKGLILTGCDDGSVVAVSARDGALRWRTVLDAGVVGGPIKLSANIYGSISVRDETEQQPVDPVLVVTYTGTLYLLDLSSGRLIQSESCGGTVIAAPLTYRHQYFDWIAVPTANGDLVFVEYSNIGLSLRRTSAIRLSYADQFHETGNSIAQLGATPAYAKGILVQGLVRQTSYKDPPLLAIDALTHQVLWTAADPEGMAGRFGNLRSPPVIVEEQVIFMTAYSSELCAVSLKDGRMLWSVPLGQGMFEQWSGPTPSGNAVYIGRHDGYLHKVRVRNRARDWSLFLGDSANAGVALTGKQRLPEFDANFAWRSGGSSPILASPTVDRGRLYVGTHEGFLYCVGNLGETEDPT